MKRFLVALAVLVFASSAFGSTANLSGISYSISFKETPVYDIFFCFTAYDGNINTIYPEFYNRELKKFGSLYKMDYVSIEGGYRDDYGEIFLNLGSGDMNSNGIDDVCEKSLSYNNVSVSGNWYSYDGESGALSGSMSRNANSHEGAYSLTAHGTDMGDMPLSGNFYVGTLLGTISYSQEEKTVSVDYTTTFDEESPHPVLETTYEIIDEGHIRVDAKDNFPTTIFTRTGNAYTAVVELIDGELSTSWPDYQKWLITIQDNNDSDGDGIPDLSDLPELKFMPCIPLLLDED